MGNKVWKFVYRDTVKKTRETDETMAEGMEEADFITTEHHPGGNAPIVYDKDGVTCYIYSDKEIPGLELVKSNRELGK